MEPGPTVKGIGTIVIKLMSYRFSETIREKPTFLMQVSDMEVVFKASRGM